MGNPFFGFGLKAYARGFLFGRSMVYLRDSGNVMGFVTGSVLGILNLAVFLGVDNNRRAGGMYADWPWKFGGASPSTRKVASYLALTSWGIGIWNVYFLALELTR